MRFSLSLVGETKKITYRERAEWDEKEIGSVVAAVIRIMPSDVSAIGVSSLVSLLTTKLLMIQSGFLELAIGSALVALTTIMHQERSAKNVDNQRR